MMAFVTKFILEKTEWGKRHKKATELIAALAETVVDIVMSPIVMGGEPKATREHLKAGIQKIHEEYGVPISEARKIIMAAAARCAPFTKKLEL